ncbi:hypothetical protein LAWI1_G007860 [Lachnellula willkommii]|uniref:Uncharacterized protein n=1 Tax=Lachnellula willkommii TaxID=215461 RepID=A0A559MFP8_9HELO|nr:hypothetical protein LAWI1_G007860 [Lachnellula willkommii]
MQFTASTLLLAGATFLSTASAAGVFAINGTAQPGSYVTLTVLNGNVGDNPTCNGTAAIGDLPASGDITCNAGYALSFVWDTQNDGISATYSTPSAAPFTYSVPPTSNDGTTYVFGFEDDFPDAEASKQFTANPPKSAVEFRA